MTTLEELQIHRNAAAIVVFTLGLAAVPVALNWKSNIFADISIAQGAMGFILKIVSFFLLTVLCAIPAFFIYLIKLIYYQIRIGKLIR